MLTNINSCLESKLNLIPTVLMYFILTELIEVPWGGTREKLLLFSVWRYLRISGRDQVIRWGQFTLLATTFFAPSQENMGFINPAAKDVVA